MSLTVHARQGGGMGICNDFVHAGSPRVVAGVQLGMAYVSPVLGESSARVVKDPRSRTGLTRQRCSVSSSRGSTGFQAPSE